MLLALDIGNSGISIGFFSFDNISNSPELIAQTRISTDTRRSSAEYVLLLNQVMEMHDIDCTSIEYAAISSVVRPLTLSLAEAAEYFTHKHPLIVGPGIRTGLNIRIDDQSQIGSDIVANTVATLSRFTAPAAIVDLGTVTTIAVADANSTLIGAILCPGVMTSMEAMAQTASQLTTSDLLRPSDLIGRNTADSINSGVINGHILMIDGFIREIRALHQTEDKKLTLVATGGLADRVIPYCRNKFSLIPHLTLLGIADIFRRNL